MSHDPDKPVDIRPYINFCKAISIILIAGWHYWGILTWHGNMYLLQKNAVSGILGRFPVSGFASGLKTFSMMLLALGVDMPHLFIIASGFGLYLSYLNKNEGWAAFYKKRLLRILPLYWAVVIILYLNKLYAPLDGPKVLFYHLLLLQDFTRYDLAFSALWFVGYIATMYALFPVLVKFFRTTRLKALLALISLSGTFIIEKTMGMAGYAPQGKLPTLYLSCFVFGMLLAEGTHYRNEFLKKLFSAAYLPVYSVAAALLLFLINRYDFFGSPQFINIFFVLLVPVLYWVFKLVSFVLPVAQKFWNITAYGSYFLFLVHQNLNVVILKYLMRQGIAQYTFINFSSAVTIASSPRNVLLEFAIFGSTLLFSLLVQYGYDHAIKSLAKPARA